MFNSQILFTGYYGMKNTGDDAFVEVASWGADKYWPKNQNRFLAPAYYLPYTRTPVRGYPLSLPRTYDLQRKFLIKNTKWLISAGGSTIHSALKADNIKKMALDVKDKNINMKVGGIGVSIGPFKTIKDESAVKKYLQQIDFIAVRDQRSFDFLTSLELPYKPSNAFDLAALLPEIYGPRKYLPLNFQRKIVGISICAVESVHERGNLDNEKRRNAKIVDIVKSLDQIENILFRFFVINGNARNGDLALTKEIIASAAPKNYEVIGYQRQTEKMWDNIASCNFVLATRLHAAIFACFAKVPFMLVEYHSKCTDFLTNVGYNSASLIGDAEFDTKEITSKIGDWINDPDCFPVPQYLSEMTQKAFLNFTDIKI